MNTIGVIPSRMGSSRFPGKPMKKIHGMPMIGHCYHRTKIALGSGKVYVATCDKEIFDYVESIGGRAIMTSDSHERCTDRCAEAMLKIENKTGKKNNSSLRSVNLRNFFKNFIIFLYLIYF